MLHVSVVLSARDNHPCQLKSQNHHNIHLSPWYRAHVRISSCSFQIKPMKPPLILLPVARSLSLVTSWSRLAWQMKGTQRGGSPTANSPVATGRSERGMTMVKTLKKGGRGGPTCPDMITAARGPRAINPSAINQHSPQNLQRDVRYRGTRQVLVRIMHRPASIGVTRRTPQNSGRRKHA